MKHYPAQDVADAREVVAHVAAQTSLPVTAVGKVDKKAITRAIAAAPA